ncbi:MAG: MarR family transcriptional regulator [Motiliproteus sp.]|nr:MarR family transcriptional regulator [Motiliproteus sp.]
MSSENPELSIIELANELSRANEHLKQLLAKIAGIHGIQKSDFDVLTALYRSGEPYRLAPRELSSQLLFSSGGLTKVLHRLTDAGLVLRDEGATDKRQKGVSLSPLGEHVIKVLCDQLQPLQQQAFGSLSHRQLQQFQKLLQRLLSDWDNN